MLISNDDELLIMFIILKILNRIIWTKVGMHTNRTIIFQTTLCIQNDITFFWVVLLVSSIYKHTYINKLV